MPVKGRHAPLMKRQRQGANAGHARDADADIQVFRPVYRRFAQAHAATRNKNTGTKGEGETADAIENDHAKQRTRSLFACRPVLAPRADKKGSRQDIHDDQAEPVEPDEN
ncbi:hypothetical protein D3C73_693830 [compost metagenome]